MLARQGVRPAQDPSQLDQSRYGRDRGCAHAGLAEGEFRKNYESNAPLGRIGQPQISCRRPFSSLPPIPPGSRARRSTFRADFGSGRTTSWTSRLTIRHASRCVRQASSRLHAAVGVPGERRSRAQSNLTGMGLNWCRFDDSLNGWRVTEEPPALVDRVRNSTPKEASAMATHSTTSQGLPGRLPLCAWRFSSSGGFLAAAGIAVALGLPSRSSGQTTISLGQAGNYGLFEVSNGSPFGKVTDVSSTITGNVALGASTSLTATGAAISGSIYEDSNASFNNVLQSSIVTGGITKNFSLATATNNANQASAAATALSHGSSTARSNHSGLNYTLTGGSTTSPNVYNSSSALNLTGANFTIHGSSNQQFVLNLASGLSLTGVTINLTGGVTAQNVIFNIIGGNVSMTGTSFAGSILDLNKNSQFSLTGDTIREASLPAVISHSSARTLLAGSSSGGVARLLVAPESPTIMMAAVACLLALGTSGAQPAPGTQPVRRAVALLQP